MTKKRSTKRALLLSFLSLLMCVSMLIGSTYAWFTDSVTSANNIIKSGTLDVTMEWFDGTEAVPADDSADWIDASTGAIFNYNLWEPGYVEVRHIKIANEGTLALKYQLNIAANGEVSKLADVIDVYYVDPADQIEDRADLANAPKLGTLTQVLANLSNTASGELKAGEDHTITLALKMQETAGNEYQNLSIGSDFSVQLLATQLTSESDSFDNQYDKEAGWNGVIPTEMPETLVLEFADSARDGGKVIVKDTEAFVYLNKLVKYFQDNTTQNPYNHYYYNMKWAVELDADINLMNIPVDIINMGFFGAGFDAKGHTISNVVVKDGQPALFNGQVISIKNLTVKNIVVNAPGVTRAAAVSSRGALENVHVINANVIGGKYVGGLVGQGSNFINCSVKASTIVGTDKTVGGLVGYCSGDPGHATATGNVVENVTVTGAWNVGGMFGQAQNVTVEGNTVKNTTVISTKALPADASSNEVRSAEVAARSAFDNTTIGANTVENVVVAKQVATADELVNAFADLKAGDVLYIANDIDMTGKTISAVTGNKGFTMLGNGYTIKNLTSTQKALFVDHSGSSSYTFDSVVLENCSVNSAAGYGALFVGDGDTSDAITITNCVVKNCAVKSGKYAAAFVAYTSGYNRVNDGPVYSDVLVSNCEVIGGSITGGGSTGVAVGHSGGNVDTTTIIKNLKVDGVAINGEDAAHTGIAVGTANVGKTIIENVTANNVTGNYNTATNLYGRFVPGTTGELTVNGVAKN